MSKIIYPQADGLPIAVVHISGEGSLDVEARKAVPAGVPYLIVPDEAVPSVRTFRGAWAADFSEPDGYGVDTDEWLALQAARAEVVNVDLTRAKEIAHDLRRIARDEAFAPLDSQLAKAIPSDDPKAIEAEREIIREDNAKTQEQIDKAGDVAALSEILAAL